MDQEAKLIKKYIKQQTQKFAYEGALIEENHKWWHEQVNNTLQEMEELVENDKFSLTKDKRMKFLEDRLAYLEKKGDFENKNIKNFHRRVKKFHGG